MGVYVPRVAVTLGIPLLLYEPLPHLKHRSNDTCLMSPGENKMRKQRSRRESPVQMKGTFVSNNL